MRLFSCFLLCILFIYSSDKCWCKKHSCETEDLTHSNQPMRFTVFARRRELRPLRHARTVKVHSKMAWKHTSSNHQYREMLINHTGHISLPQENVHCPWLHKTWERNNNEDFTLYAFYCQWKEHTDILFLIPFVCLHVIQMLFSPCSADYDVHNIAFHSKNPHFLCLLKFKVKNEYYEYNNINKIKYNIKKYK